MARPWYDPAYYQDYGAVGARGATGTPGTLARLPGRARGWRHWLYEQYAHRVPWAGLSLYDLADLAAEYENAVGEF